MADVSLADGLESRFSVTFANDEEDGVSLLLQTEGGIMGLSDAGAHVSQICDAVMPTDFLSSWVRDREVMSLEQGVRKLTGELSDVLGIGRGSISVGCAGRPRRPRLGAPVARADPPPARFPRRR